MKLEKAKNLQNVFKPNLDEMSRRKHKSEEQNNGLEKIKLL